MTRVNEYYDDLLDRRQPPKWDHLSWVTVRALLAAVNDVFARGSKELVADTRARWVALQRARGFADGEYARAIKVDGGDRSVGFVLNYPRGAPAGDRRSFFVLGDPGDADASQYAVIQPLIENETDYGKTDFMVLCSDVVYPSGDINAYINAFFIPYGWYDRPIFAIPGNHDWYDGLTGFMFHFCNAEPLPVMKFNWTSYSLRQLIFQLLWRRGSLPRRRELATFRLYGARAAARVACPAQPGPYWAIDIGPLVLVGIDTGVTGEIDAEQGEWLRTVSRLPKDKVLLTGKPLYVDQKREPCTIDTFKPKTVTGFSLFPQLDAVAETVAEIVHNPAHRYRAVIGGDVHNYQRYEVNDQQAEEASLHAFVSGGGGAYLTNTHRIAFWPRQAFAAAAPESIALLKRLYPQPEESLRLYVEPAHRVLSTVVRGLLLFVASAAAAFAALLATDDATANATRALWADGVALGILLAVFVVLARFVTNHERFIERGVLTLSPLLGALVPLAGRWLIPGRLEEASLVGGPILGTMLFLTILDRQGDWSLKVGWLGLLLLAIGGCLFALTDWADFGFAFHSASGIAALALVPASIGVISRLLRRNKGAAFVTTLLLSLGAVGGFVSWYVYVSFHVLYAQVTFLGTFAWAVATLVFASHFRDRVPAAAAFVGLLPIVLLGYIEYVVYEVDPRYPRLVVALLVATIVFAGGATLLYLVWLRGLQNLCWLSGLQRWGRFQTWHGRKRSLARCEHLGMIPLPWPSILVDRQTATELTEINAKEYLSARTSSDSAAMLDLPERVRRCFDTIIPRPRYGTGVLAAKRSPLSRFVSELFDPRKPPFYKSFLRCEVARSTTGEWTLTISAFAVDGTTPKARLIDEVSMKLA